MQRLSRVLFEVGPSNTNGAGGAVFHQYLKASITDDRRFKLAYLVAFRRVWIEVVFAVKHRALAYLGADA